MNKGENMFTPQNVDLNANSNPEYVQEQRVTCQHVDEEKVANWTPDDLLNALKTVGFPFNARKGYSVVPDSDELRLVEILSDKLFAWEKEGKISYDKISEILHVASRRLMGINGGLFIDLVAMGDWQPVIDFLAKFVLLVEKDARYYDLLEMMLIIQPMGERAFPLGARIYMKQKCKDVFVNEVLNKLPAVCKERLLKNTYYYYDDDSDRTYCYSLSGKLVSVD